MFLLTVNRVQSKSLKYRMLRDVALSAFALSKMKAANPGREITPLIQQNMAELEPQQSLERLFT